MGLLKFLRYFIDNMCSCCLVENRLLFLLVVVFLNAVFLVGLSTIRTTGCFSVCLSFNIEGPTTLTFSVRNSNVCQTGTVKIHHHEAVGICCSPGF